MPATIAIGLLLMLGFAQSGFAQSTAGPLTFENNFFVSGDYVVAGAYNMNSNMVNVGGITYTTGTINVPDKKPGTNITNPGITGPNSVPPGAEILAALLYWQTVEKTSTIPGQPGSGQNGFFRPVNINGGPPAPGYPLTGVDLMSQNTVSFSNGGCTGGSTGKVVRTYRAPVIGYLPQDPATGSVSANGSYEIRLPSTGNSTPLTLGATLVIIYRVLSPNVPLNSIVIYDGAYGASNTSLTMTQTVQGFYQAGQNPVSRLTHIVGSGQSNKFETVYLHNIAIPSLYGHGAPAFPGYYGNWDNPTWTFPDLNVPAIGNLNPVKEDDASETTMVVPAASNQGCVTWGAVIVSTTVKNTDGDGLLDVWKKPPTSPNTPGYCDASVNEGVCRVGDTTDPSWVSLPGAAPHQKDVFVQLDYMCSRVTGPGSCDTTNGYSFDPRLSVDPADGKNPVQKVIDAFGNHTVNLHIIPTNAIQEQTCQDDFTTSPPTLCPYPNQAGVVGWKGGLVFLKNQLIDPISGNFCTTTSPAASCVPILPPGKKDSYHYALFAHAVGLPSWTLGAGTLTNIVQSGHTVAFTTSTNHGLVSNVNDSCPSRVRVTVAFAITNPNLNGTFCATLTGPKTFSIQVANSTSFTYTFHTDPDLEIGSSQAGTVSGYSDVGGQDSVIALGNWGLDATQQVKTGTFMHELGHSLGLTHGGFYYNTAGSYVPTPGQNCKSNYLSVMNYMFQIDLLDPGNGNPVVPDYSGQMLANISKSAGGSNPFIDPLPPYLTSWHGTSVQAGVPASTTPLTMYCDGTPFPGANPGVYRVTRPASLFAWAAGQDINFDGVINDPTFIGYNDWAPNGTLTTGIELRQIGATGSLSAAGMVGGGKVFGGGGGKVFGGGGGQQFGAGGGKVFGGGGGKQFGAGGGKVFGGGGGLSDLNQSIANSFTRPPGTLSVTMEDPSPRYIHLKWTAPNFGQIGAYRIYRSADGGLTFNPVPNGNNGAIQATLPTVPGAQVTYTDTVNCNTPKGYQYYVTGLLAGTFPPFPAGPGLPGTPTGGQESVPSNTVSAIPPSTNKLTGCYILSNFSSPTSAEQGTVVPISWILMDDFYPTNGLVSVNTVNTLVANGPIPGNCTTNGSTPILLPQNPLTPTSPGNFTFNWNTDTFCAGSYTFQLTLDSTQTQTTTIPLQLQIDINDLDAPHITTTTLTAGIVGSAYPPYQLTQEGGVGSIPTFQWTVTSGSLPAGVSLGLNSGVLSGTPCDKPGPYLFTVQVKDSVGNVGTQKLKLDLLAAPVAQINQPTAPESAVPGAALVNPLKVNGAGFTACSNVLWNGGALATTLASGTQLTATIPAPNVASAATASVSVANIGSPTSNVDFFQITNPTASVYLNRADVPVGINPNGLVAADFNGDGKLDLAITNSGDNTVSILLGNGDGTFTAIPIPLATGSVPYSLTAGDFNNDKKLDLAVTNFANGAPSTVSIFTGNGDGTFLPGVTYAVGNGPISVVTGDFNKDGKLDLAVTNQNDHSVSVLLGNGDGTFQAHVDYPAVVAGAGGLDVAGVAVGDFNGDGKLDLTVTNPSSDQVSILLGNGDGTFQTPVSYSTGATGSHPIAVSAADFNGDGILDLAVTNLNVENVAIFLGNGNGTFQPQVSYSTTSGGMIGPSAMTTGDFNGDGQVDLAISDQSENSVSILLGNGNGTFQNPLEFFTTGTSSAGVAAGDFSGDGRLDVAVANFSSTSVSVMLQAPHVLLGPSTLAFGNVATGTSTGASVVTLTNDGSAALAISNIAKGGSNPGDFSQTNNCPVSPSTLAAGSNCAINVIFAPTVIGARSATVSITDNASGNPQMVNLTGSGFLAPPTSLTANAASGSVALAWSASPSAVGGYNVYQATVSGGSYTKLTTSGPTTNLFFTDTTVQSGTPYYYVIRAVDASANESSDSNEATATP